MQAIARSAVSYEKLPGLDHVRLEDSFVIDFVEERSRIAFVLQIMLLPGHALYAQPMFGVRACYGHGILEIREVREVRWRARVLRAFADKDGRVDYGNIDALTFDPERWASHLEGEWGVVDVEGLAPSLAVWGRSRR
jgi:hypothetical protein